ncbi:AAA family ATPase [Falsiruegeria mediterranea]|uniref:Uncharacterized protein n=1 Tax=Falsiruegeria mediterranea M17 TaxID=1200281 RepID=A0A2R8CFK4_9RHOB|nr:ATP-binding protein [Falsiruegeria mediterranea]SPJ31232.1 hypothetical protein TRM7615_04775 [Falsiruegeria mediterranea M17]
MSSAKPMLHMICGKIASGKSTLAQQIVVECGALRISEDEWLAKLFGDQMSSIADFARCSEKLRDAMGPHVLDLLGAGVSVVLDFQANTVSSRQWLRSLIDCSGVDHVLHVLDVPDAVCKARLDRRNASGSHEFIVSESQFDQIAAYFVPPAEDERFNTVTHRGGSL